MAFDSLAEKEALAKYVDLHANCQHGDISEVDEVENDWSRVYGGPVVSEYPLAEGYLFIRTDLGRNTIVMMKDEDRYSTDPIEDDSIPF